jgi:heme-degrading monooxygenase HmoA
VYARVITTQLKPGQTDSAIKVWQDSAVPLLKKQPGFQGAYLVGDRTTGKGVTITLWDSEANASAMDSSGQYQRAVAMFAELLAAPPSREQFEVFVQV